MDFKHHFWNQDAKIYPKISLKPSYMLFTRTLAFCKNADSSFFFLFTLHADNTKTIGLFYCFYTWLKTLKPHSIRFLNYKRVQRRN